MTDEIRTQFGCDNCKIDSIERYNLCAFTLFREDITICEKEYYEEEMERSHRHEEFEEECRIEREKEWRKENGYLDY